MILVKRLNLVAESGPNIKLISLFAINFVNDSEDQQRGNYGEMINELFCLCLESMSRSRGRKVLVFLVF